jgi:septal ring factor EnvC (AmiA/AmiB activator)
MTMSLLLRRVAIVAACALAIGGVVGIVRTAAVLRADAAPLVAAPVSPEQIAAEIATESSRAAGLAAALAELETRTTDIDDSLSAAGDQMTMDAATAAQLRSDLAVAKDRLATLEAELRAAQERLARLLAAGDSTAAAAPASATTAAEDSHGEVEEHEEGDDD